MINASPSPTSSCDRPTVDPLMGGQIVQVPKGARWQICYRLRELQIPCACPADGTLRVTVDHAIALLLVRSTVQRLTAERQDLLDWLERCWQTPFPN
ncbi:MAG: Asr1405/Asl0597 family protein [Thermosynechococcaceae cyanobacterium]